MENSKSFSLPELLKHREKLLQIAAAEGATLWIVLEANAAANARVTSLDEEPQAPVALVARMPENGGGLIALGELEALISESIGFNINVYGESWFSEGLTEQPLK